MKNQDLPELNEQEIAAAIREGQLKKRAHLKAIENGVQFDENGEIISFSPETEEMIKRGKEL